MTLSHCQQTFIRDVIIEHNSKQVDILLIFFLEFFYLKHFRNIQLLPVWFCEKFLTICKQGRIFWIRFRIEKLWVEIILSSNPRNLKQLWKVSLKNYKKYIYLSGRVADSISLTGFAHMKLCYVIIIPSVLFRDIYLYSKLPISLVNAYENGKRKKRNHWDIKLYLTILQVSRIWYWPVLSPAARGIIQMWLTLHKLRFQIMLSGFP